ncbi:MAG: NapC/NirT family cytochrome c [Cohaesibacter sp.]|nr:NapC/NirT family cytochrome c [Cohaesibacter sp.]MCV6600011.1 NapC/NirT family cytochrome c [Cohaesibacter sp.]
MTEQDKKGGLLSFFTKPALSIAAGTLLVVGFIVGILFWGGFNWSMEMTNNEEFCISCHEMEAHVFQEYRDTIHYANRTGVRATCPDCHVPKEWNHKVVRKIKASKELYYHFTGELDTKEKFEGKRLELATNVWEAMKTTDSRECRNCHDFGSMDLSAQENRASDLHQKALQSGGTCIDCHKGIAHKLPSGADEAMAKLYKELGKPLPHEAGYFKE